MRYALGAALSGEKRVHTLYAVGIYMNYVYTLIYLLHHIDSCLKGGACSHQRQTHESQARGRAALEHRRTALAHKRPAPARKRPAPVHTRQNENVPLSWPAHSSGYSHSTTKQWCICTESQSLLVCQQTTLLYKSLFMCYCRVLRQHRISQNSSKVKNSTAVLEEMLSNTRSRIRPQCKMSERSCDPFKMFTLLEQ